MHRRSKVSLVPIVAFVLSISVPLGLFGWTALRERDRTLEEAERTAVRTVAALHEHTLKVLENQALVFDEVERAIEGRVWDEIERDAALHERLSRLTQRLDQIQAINLVDATGRVRLSTSSFPPPDRIVTERDYFEAQREQDAGTYIGPAYTSHRTGERLIGLSRRHATPDGNFDGIVHIAVPLAYFTAFWEGFAPDITHLIPLVRADGQVIARHPAPETPPRLDVNGPFMSRALRQPSGTYTAVSRVDGIERFSAYQKIKGYPLFISFSIETRAILEQWRQALILYALFAALAAGALAAGAYTAFRRYQVQEAASRRWHETADQLAAEMARREAAEASLRQSQKMEALGQLTGGVAHDFNNLLAVISASLEVLKPRLPVGDPRALRLVDNAMQAADRGALLIQRMLVFARKQDLAPKPVDVSELVQGMTELLARSIGPQVDIQTRFAADLPQALVDPNQLEIAILNLAVNARDAMPRGGVLIIEVARERREDGGKAGEYVRLSVSDTGVGMDEATLARAMEPFFTTKEIGRGTGLGLSMVYGLADQSGGRLRLTSKPGEGTTADILLPAVSGRSGPGTIPSAPVSLHEAAGEASLVVLAVDDDALVLNGTAALLEELGHRVVEAPSASEALGVLRSGCRVDVVMTDELMPGMTGLQLASVLQAEHPGLPVVLATGCPDIAPEADTLVSVRLNKPFGRDILAAALSRATALRARKQTSRFEHAPRAANALDRHLPP